MKMEEVKHVWSTLRSVTKSTTSLSNTSVNSTAVWYDVPAPVIIHCHDFREGKIERDEPHETRIVEVTEKASSSSLDEDRIYENNVEATAGVALRTKERPVSESLDHQEAQTDADVLKKHRNTLELTAVTCVETNEDGMPTISFSFLQNSGSTPRKSEVEETESVHQDQLYDFPKNPRVRGEATCEKVVESSTAETGDRKIDDESGGEIEFKPSDPEDLGIKDSRSAAPNDPASSVDDKSSDCSKSGTADLLSNLANSTIGDSPDKSSDYSTRFVEEKSRQNQSKRSVRSLKSGRRSCGLSESEGYDAGIASMSGSYSDPEYPSDGLSSSPARLQVQKRRLGKAWNKMRSWIRDEKIKINEVVTKHARLQAVGALTSERVPKSRFGSYDLTKARTQELGSLTRVEEFGLSCVSEETDNVVLSDCNLEHGEENTEENAASGESAVASRKTESSDSVFNGEAKAKRLPAASLSAERLGSDTENEEAEAVSPTESEAREQARKAGLIKRRMLGSIRGLMASTHLLQNRETEEGGQSGFEDVRRYVKQGGDFCKELAAILHERAELEATYAKGLSKLSNKLTKACAKDQGGNSSGGVNEAWRSVGEEMEAAAEAHRVWGIALTEQLAKPLRVGVAEAQGRSRKTIENSVDKAGKSLQEWRGVASKSKKQSFTCARENERLQDLARLQSISQTQQSNNKSTNHHLTDKEANKLETRRRKAEDSSRRADTEFYTVSVRAERARLEYESTVRKGAKQMELLEEERLSALKDLANVYLAHLQALAPRLQQSADRLTAPIRNCNVSQDIEILKNLIRRVEGNDTCNVDQLLPDFYAEHVTLAMNRERRKQSLVRVLHLIRQDLERERRGREGLETLHRAFITTPTFVADETTQNVADKLHHMRSMLLYLEAARYKVGSTLAEVEGSKRGKHPLAEHILVSRDKQGLQQSVLKIPSWAKNESFEIPEGEDEIDVHLGKDHETESRHWADRTAGDGNSENPPDEDDFSDFDEFSSHSEDNNNQDFDAAETASKAERAEQCRAIYQYSANLNDELSLNPGDLITVHQKQPDGWWIGECKGRTGIFPATYVQVIH